MVLALHLLALAGYLSAWVLEFRGFRARKRRARDQAVPVAAIAAAVHLGGLMAFGFVHDTAPLVGLGPASSSLALAIAVVFLIAAAVRPDTRAAGLFVFPIVLLLLGEAVLVGVVPASREVAFRGPWFVFHVASVFTGFAGLLLASAAGLMYLLQFRALKRKTFGSVFRFFPSLDALDALNGVGLAVGFPALTVGLIAGWSFTLTYGRGLELGEAEVLFGVVTWVLYLVAILARVPRGWHGDRAARVTAGAFALSAATFMVLRVTASPSGFFL